MLAQAIVRQFRAGRASDGTRPYLLAHFAKSQLWHASTLLFGFFLTERCGFDARTMGAVMAGSLVLNGIVDAVVGARWQASVVTAAAAARRQALGAPVACMFFLLFCATPLFDAVQRVGWAIAMLVAFRATYPFIDVPQNALVALIALGPDARCVLLARRNMMSGLANLTVAVLAAPLLMHGRGVAVWLLWAIAIALFASGTAWMLHGGKGERAGGDERPAEAEIEVEARVAGPALFGALAAMMVAAATFRTLQPYHAAYVGAGMGLPAWAAIGAIASQPAWAAGRRRFGITAVLTAAAAVLLVAAHVLLTPFRASGAGTVVVGVAFGAGSSGLWLILWSAMMARAATGHATGQVGLFTCVSKLAQAAAMLVLGQVLAISPYRATLADPWSPPSLLMTGALGVMAAVCVVAIFAFRPRLGPRLISTKRRWRRG